MSLRCRSKVGFAAVVFAILSSYARAAASAQGAAPLPAFRTLLARPFDNLRLRQVVERAARRLRRPRCQRLLTEFSDDTGQPLQVRLDALGLSSERYLAHVVFVDAEERAGCGKDEVLAFTSPGSRVVGVCAPSFFRVLRRDPTYLEAIVIHEALHTLGLGENPPSAVEITKRVLEQCL